MSPRDVSFAQPQRESLLATHTVLRNTYLLLGLTLLFSGLVAGFAMAANVPFPGLVITLLGTYGLMFLTMSLRNSPWGLVSVFAFTGFMGYTLAPLLNAYVAMGSGQAIATAFGGTGLIFLALSAYVLTTRRSMDFLAGFLFVGFWVLLLAMFAGFFLHMSGFQVMLSAGFILFSSAAILFETSQIIQGGQTNYILATISLYVSLYNIFVSLLNIFGRRD